MNLAEEVYSPFTVILCNLPLTVKEGKRVCRYSNKDIVVLIQDFAESLKKTVKVVYNKDGVIPYNRGAIAYAVFKEYHDAFAVSDALKNMGRGQVGYWSYLQSSDRRSSRDMDEIFGWLATADDFKRLAGYGCKEFKEYKKITVGAIMEEKLLIRSELEAEYDTLRMEIDELDKVLEEQKTALDRATMDLAGAKADDLAARSAVEEERKRREEELEKERLRCDEESKAAQRELEEMRLSLQHREYEEKEKMRAVHRHVAAQEQFRRAKSEVEYFRNQCRLEDTGYQEQGQEEREKREAAREKLAEALSLARVKREEYKLKTGVQGVKAEGITLAETDCTVCEWDFTKIMTCTEQKAAGISPMEFNEMNKREPSGDHCWRNFLVPCFHSKLCGGCLYQMQEDAKRKGKDMTCPHCRCVIETYMPLRYNTG